MTQPPRRLSVKLPCSFLFLVVLLYLQITSHAYQPAVPSVPPSLSNLVKNSLTRHMPMTADVSSSLISQLAEVALKMRLADHTDVSCQVTANSPTDLLLHGRVGPVTVKGKGWQSGLGLTCRALEATVDHCQVDVARILKEQKLSLVNPAVGKAMIALSQTDFANFITHPLMKPPAAVHGNALTFVNEGTAIDATTGTVQFQADCAGKRYQCVLQRGEREDQRAVVQVQPAAGGDNDDMTTLPTVASAAQMAESLTAFFNNMVFELDGTFLSFRDMMVTNKGSSPSVMLALDIKVHKLPSRSLAF